MTTDNTPGAGLDVYRPGELTVPEVRELAGDLVDTDFVPKALRGKRGAVLACILTGQELGIGPMSSLAKVHVIEGRPALSAELMRAIILRAGHHLWLEESSATRVTIAGARKETPDHVTRITWTMDDAKRARVSNKDNWTKYPRAMLTARATGELARMVFPDVLAGISYTKEEVEDGFTLDEDLAVADGIPTEGPEGTPPAPPPATAPRRRRAPDANSRAPKPTPEPASIDPEEDLDDVEDAVVVEDAGQEPEPIEDAAVAPERSARSATPAQRTRLAAERAGMSEDDRRALYVAVTSGRTNLGKELTDEERSTADALIARIALGEVAVFTEGGERWVAPVDAPDDWLAYGAWVPDFAAADGLPADPEFDVDDEVIEAELVDDDAGQEEPEEADDVDLGTEEGWRAYIKAKGIRLADVLRAAKNIAGAGGMSLKELAADPELSAKVADHFDGAS